MEIKEITDQLGNDFFADLECEHCGHVQKLDSGYNDAFYHSNVLPAIKCQSCGKDRNGNTEK